MEFNMTVLLTKLNQYYDSTLTRDELGSWARKAYYEILRGDFIVIDKIVIYRFLRTISTIHIVANDAKDEYPCSEEDVSAIHEILRGSKNAAHTLNIKLPTQIYDMFGDNINLDKSKLNTLIDIRECISEYLENKSISLDKREKLFLFSNQDFGSNRTLLDLLECHIVSILSDCIDYEEETLDFERSIGIFVGRKEINENLCLSLLKLLDCAIGNTSFIICITYDKGKSNISIST